MEWNMSDLSHPLSFPYCYYQDSFKWADVLSMSHCCWHSCLYNRSYFGSCSVPILLPAHCGVDVKWTATWGRLSGPVGGLRYLFCLRLLPHHQNKSNSTQTSESPGNSSGVTSEWIAVFMLSVAHRLMEGAHLSAPLTQRQIWRRVNWAQVQLGVPVDCRSLFCTKQQQQNNKVIFSLAAE